MEKLVIGLDFGTLSGRAVLMRVADGAVLAQAARPYAHGVITGKLPGGGPLRPDFALQHPQDYLDVLEAACREALRTGAADPAAVIGIGLDFTGSTVVALDREGVPLCLREAFCDRPHAWVKLWKHHAAWREADDFTRAMQAADGDLLLRCGGRVSSECLFPKALQVLREDPALFDEIDQFMEAGDWVTMRMTGAPVRSAACAALKAFWRKGRGYPDDAFLALVDRRLIGFPARKLRGPLGMLGTRAGNLTAEMAARLGLLPGTAVSVAQFDSHAALPALGITGPGTAMLTVGTSLGISLAGEEARPVEGICSLAEDGNLPGYWGYASGQCSAGDLLNWYVENAAPASYAAEADARGIGLHALLSEKAERLMPGESGLLALDWWNGNRSCLVDAELSGLLVGMTLSTKPEMIYRALMEGIAFGTRRILDSYAEAGVPIRQVYACGGVVQKNAVMMRLYADILDMPLRVSLSPQAPAIGAAMFAAAAAGMRCGGYDTVAEAASRMHCLSRDVSYAPVAAHRQAYDRLYAEYVRLHDYFGRGENDVMKQLRGMRAGAGGNRYE